MRTAKSLIILLFVCPISKAQNINLDKSYFSTPSILFPENVLSVEKRTYSVGGSNNSGAELNSKDNVKLCGFTYAETGIVNVRTSYSFPLAFSGKIPSSRTDVKTNTIFYSYSSDVSCDGRITIECPEKDYKRYELANFRKTYHTKEFPSAQQASDAFDSQNSFWMDDAKLQFQKYVINYANYMLNKAFGYPTANTSVKVWIIGSKDDSEYDNFQKNFALIKENFKAVAFDSIPPSVITNLEPAIKYFQSVPTKYTTDDKAAKKIRYAAYYMLMKIYFQLDDLAKAEEYANLIITNDYDKKDGKQMLEDIKKIKEKWAANNVISSHFHIVNGNGVTYSVND